MIHYRNRQFASQEGEALKNKMDYPLVTSKSGQYKEVYLNNSIVNLVSLTITSQLYE